MNIARHPLVKTLVSLRGNARACVYTEPLWGIPYNLYAPYISVYMLSFGITDQQIGLITSIGWSFQIVMALLSGAITDKLGRRWTTFIFDFVAWSVPCLIWAVAQNFTYFVIAAIVNSAWRITMNSWTCLLVEDAEPDHLIDMYSWIYISGLLVAFFAPAAGFLIEKFSLVPTMRGLYLLAFVLMTAKFVILYFYSTETRQGKVRMEETRQQNMLGMLGEYRHVFRQILASPRTLYTGGVMLVMSICSMVNNTFWSILVTEKIHIPAQHIALYPFAKSTIMLFFFFLVMPRIREIHFRNPMLIGLGGYILSQVILILVPVQNYPLLLLSIFIEACSVATVNPLMDRLTILNVDPQERARVQSILYVLIITLTTPFGWIAGYLSSLDRIFPFILNLALFSLGAVLVYLVSRAAPAEDPALAATAGPAIAE